ncbi:glutathione S-transferase family protein [Roseibium sp.]|uniref:glutathione S-transferase family protein n=1 Tax=Roseibium sp. TaxID=1936156 RepID=UPI003A96E239
MLVDGKWSADWHPVQKKDADGRFVRQVSSFRHWITPDGSPGPDAQPATAAEMGRYHLYVAYICPWACRTLIARSLKGLEDVISVSVVEPVLSDEGWRFGDFPGATGPDREVGASHIHGIYTEADPIYTGRATVPVLWDRKARTIVNNESADILRILNEGFGALATSSVDLRPNELLQEMEELSDKLYGSFNNGVYRAGFASSQKAYEEAVHDVFAALAMLERRLSDGRAYLMGAQLTEVDIRAYVTLIRFDAAYVGLFKCNLREVRDYPAVSAYLRRLYAMPAFRSATRFDHIKAGYYSVKALNPSGIVPQGPDLSYLTHVLEPEA